MDGVVEGMREVGRLVGWSGQVGWAELLGMETASWGWLGGSAHWG